MATRFREPSMLRDPPGVIGVGGAEVRNVVRAGPRVGGRGGAPSDPPPRYAPQSCTTAFLV